MSERSARNLKKLLYKTGVIFQGYILSEKLKRSKKYVVENYEKTQFSIEIFI